PSTKTSPMRFISINSSTARIVFPNWYGCQGNLGAILSFVHATFRRVSFVFLFSVFITLCACRKASSGGDFQAGMDAYADGDYKTALEKWRPLAEAGDPASQTNLG